jgi:predicted GIY-YIG superfamily endonuclease
LSHVYLLHFDPPFGHAGHYVGYTTRDNIGDRVAEHTSGRGARMCRLAVAAGCEIKLARVWRDVPRKHELKIKGRSVKPRCPICHPNRKFKVS